MKDLHTPAAKNNPASSDTRRALYIAHRNPQAEVAGRITDIYTIYDGIDETTGEESVTFFLLPDPYAQQGEADQYYTTGEVDPAVNEEFFK